MALPDKETKESGSLRTGKVGTQGEGLKKKKNGVIVPGGKIFISAHKQKTTT